MAGWLTIHHVTIQVKPSAETEKLFETLDALVEDEDESDLEVVEREEGTGYVRTAGFYCNHESNNGGCAELNRALKAFAPHLTKAFHVESEYDGDRTDFWVGLGEALKKAQSEEALELAEQLLEQLTLPDLLELIRLAGESRLRLTLEGEAA